MDVNTFVNDYISAYGAEDLSPYKYLYAAHQLDGTISALYMDERNKKLCELLGETAKTLRAAAHVMRLLRREKPRAFYDLMAGMEPITQTDR